MAKKPFPFKVCEQCCTTGGGTGGDFTETDPTVPDWAKQPTKPTYTADEVGAYTKTEIDNFNFVTQYYVDQIENRVFDIENRVNDTYTKNEVDGMVGDIESALDELHAYAQALVSGGVN